MPSSAFGADDLPAAPPVLGSEHVSDSDPGAEIDPPEEQDATSAQAVFIPTAGIPDEQDQVEIQLRRTDQDELALPVFTSVEKLVDGCGEDQSWVAFTADMLPELVAATGASGIAEDVTLPSTERGDDDG